MSFQLVEQLQQKAVPVNQVCRVLDVSRLGYYTARKHARAQPLVCEASVHLRAAFAASGGAYGSRRLRTAVASRWARNWALPLAPSDAQERIALGVEAKIRALRRPIGYIGQP
jgi:hypothetical protein